MPAFRSVVSVLLRSLGDFSLHPQDQPAGGRLRRPSSRRQQHNGHRGSTLPPDRLSQSSHDGAGMVEV